MIKIRAQFKFQGQLVELDAETPEEAISLLRDLRKIEGLSNRQSSAEFVKAVRGRIWRMS